MLFALLAEARELSNNELDERAGLRLDGKERRRLNDLKLVDSHKEGRVLVHELTDLGWRWCAEELTAGPGARPGSIERAFYAVLAGLSRYLDASERSLADIFVPGKDAALSDAEVEDAIATGYRILAREPGEFVKLSGLRGQLGDVPREATDAALGRMYKAQRVNLVPQSNQRALTDADRESALRIGGEFKHLISIERR
ncbi:MAG: hypothetical protein GEV11_15385 [Streptosporangiales bacterium]|nr:hypothetical protein [Streptosporangiales bacterium]